MRTRALPLKCSYSSWGSGDCSYGSSCMGCSISQMQQETFPIFPALLNAIHQKGASVRVVVRRAPKCARGWPRTHPSAHRRCGC